MRGKQALALADMAGPCAIAQGGAGTSVQAVTFGCGAKTDGVMQLPAGAYCYIPNFWDVYRRFVSASPQRVITDLPKVFSVRPFQINDGKCVDNLDGGKVVGNRLVTKDCDVGDANQQWSYDSSSKQVRWSDPSWCWGVQDGMGKLSRQENVNGASVQLQQCDANDPNQKFATADEQWRWNQTYCVNLGDGNVDGVNSQMQVTDCAKAAPRNAAWAERDWQTL